MREPRLLPISIAPGRGLALNRCKRKQGRIYLDRHLHDLQIWAGEHLMQVFALQGDREALVNSWSEVAGDASGRRYFRLAPQGHSAIVMDSSADIDSAVAFARVAELMREGGE